jgi:hypothetical protein
MINTRTLDRIGHDTQKVKNDVIDLVNDSSARINHGIEKIAGGAQDTVSTTAKTVVRDVGKGLTQYNSRVDGLVAKMPGDINKKASRYPWVAMSMVLVTGLIIGVVIGTASSH